MTNSMTRNSEAATTVIPLAAGKRRRSLPNQSSSVCTRSSLARMPRASSFLSIFALFLLVNHPHCSTVFAQQHPHTQEPQCKPKDPTQYDWEQLNYYELLGLSDKDASKKKNRRKKKASTGSSSTNNNKASAISSKEIRKAYRKQAQKYHPDKQASKKKSQNDETATTYEESNARFAKIAEAYEFLLDDDKRRDYDLFLEYCHNTELLQDDDQHEGRLSTVIRKKFSGLFDDLAVENPFKVFKKAVFGDDNDDDMEDYFDPNDPFSHLRYKDELQRHPNHQEDDEEKIYQPQGDPVRIFHDKRIMYDPVTGENMIRVLQTEEYAPTKSSQSTKSKPNTSSGGTRGGRNSTASSKQQQQQQKQFYYRIVAQDFREGYDPHNAKQVYVPVTEPYLQEDGFRWESGARKVSNRDFSSTSIESILHPWQVLTPKSKPMISPNGRYIAGLSVDCEFLVMINPDHPSSNTHVPPEILWSTKRPYGKHGYVEDHCFALLKGPHLVVTIGENPQHQQFGGSGQNRILWHSDARNDEDDSRDGYYEYEDEFGFWHKRQRSYLAQLDNDGALTVYSVWSVPQENKDNYSQKGGQQFYSPRNNLSSYKTKLLVANVANRAKDFWKGRTLAKDEYDHLYSSSKSLTYKRCVYSTHGSNLPLGLGCSIVSRKLHQLAYECAFYARRVLFTINAVTDTWLDLIYEEDDIFYTLKESFVNSKMATLSARMIRKIQETLKQLQFKK